MQSAAPHVLATLERTPHARARRRRRGEARAAGFEHVSLDLIYGTPGERDERLGGVARRRARRRRRPRQRLRADASSPARGCTPGSARGRLPAPDDDVLARRYRDADAALAAAGLRWYEISNWAAATARALRHNLGYWRSHDWWGVGPGRALARRRRALVERPASARATRARSPRARRPPPGASVLTAGERRTERMMLERPAGRGLALDGAGAPARRRGSPRRAPRPAALARGVARLTLDGRLLADGVARDLLAD